MIRTTLAGAVLAICIAGVAAPVYAAETYDESASYLAAVLGYTKAHCPDMRPNWAAVKEHLAALGYAGLETPMPQNVIAAATRTMQRMEAEDSGIICRRIWGQFGAGGAALPDTFLRK